MRTRWSFFAILLLALGFSPVQAVERHSDPDGCFSCHGLPDLSFLDKNGVLRVATILKSDYYSSLHGSVPCKDCHRKIEQYPHKPEEGYVDCSETCHVNEPSKGKAFTHKEVVKEFKLSAHGRGHAPGATKDFHGGNRLKEETDEQNPSCRRCHSNTPYISAANLEFFKTEFHHTETECGNCHQGETWLNQYSGHVLRRLSGSHFSKTEINAMCNDCHADAKLMEEVKLQDYGTKEKKAVDYRWVHASDSYDKTLHGRLIKDGVMDGASCLDCHSNTGNHHAVMRDEDPDSVTHTDHLAKTCAQSGCHGYSMKFGNEGFTQTDMHNVDWLRFDQLVALLGTKRIESNWFKAAAVFAPLALIFVLGNLLWQKFGERKGTIVAVVGGERFQRVMIGSKPNKAKKPEGRIAKWIARLKQLFGSAEPAPPPVRPKPAAAPAHKPPAAEASPAKLVDVPAAHQPANDAAPSAATARPAANPEPPPPPAPTESGES